MVWCMRCHGTDLRGGASKKSCLGPGCHDHPGGYAERTSERFHGLFLKRNGYPLRECAACHGADFTGGVCGTSCSGSTCHRAADGGPGACYTCHGDPVTRAPYPNAQGAHRKHLEGSAIAAYTIACDGCHTVPTSWDSPGHLDGTNPLGAEVSLLDPLAATRTKGAAGLPSYDAPAKTCRNVYCHGNFTNGNDRAPAWDGGTGESACGSCHGDPVSGNPLPKAPHVSADACHVCHEGVVDTGKRIIDASKHVNGKLNVFGGTRTDW
ncbi:MAG: CxxxxCH/CxxCH domain-containing protein [Bacteroidota bacterium]|nr:CxxxxCH/CxxCH domain-containing protein [Bacteroidota bacterium]